MDIHIYYINKLFIKHYINAFLLLTYGVGLQYNLLNID